MNRKLSALLTGAVLAISPALRISAQSPQSPAFSPTIPKTWDDQAMAMLEVPLADPIGSPKHVSSDYYYKVPVRADLQDLYHLCARARTAGLLRLASAAGAEDYLG